MMSIIYDREDEVNAVLKAHFLETYSKLYSMICYRNNYIIDFLDILKTSSIHVTTDRNDNIMYSVSNEVLVRSLHIVPDYILNCQLIEINSSADHLVLYCKGLNDLQSVNIFVRMQ